MQVVNIPLRDGQSADAHSRPSHGQLKKFYKAFRNKPDAEMMDTQGDLILILCEKWDVRDGDGAQLPLSRDGIDKAPQDIVTELTDKLSEFLDTEKAEAGK